MTKALLVAALTAVVISVTGCAGASKPEPTPTIEPQPAATQTATAATPTIAPRPAATQTAPAATPESSDLAGPCLDAFVTAAGVDEMADTVSDLYPAVRVCESIEAWIAGYDAVNGAGFSGSATDVLGNVCFADEVASEPLCLAVN